MSDDEYYYDADYDDFHEMLYDADATPDLADDLAERATYSPLWQDNPTEELRDYFSDWEYYSDDYFDDDPNLLNGVTKTGDGQRLGAHRLTSAKRGRKRKLSEVREHPKLEKKEMDALTACLQGTVWKSRSPELGIAYKKGLDSPVALQLSEEIMRSAYSRKRGFGKARFKRDESWANDLGLADMGLKAERSMSMHEQPNEDNEHEDLNEDANDEQEDSVDEEAVEAETLVEEPYRIDVQAELAPLKTSVIQEEIDHGRTPRKRRKLSMSAHEPRKQTALPTPDGSLDRDQSDTAMGETKVQEVPAKRSRVRPAKSEIPSKKSAEKAKEETKPSTGPGRKRKLSASSAIGSTASTRAKRVDIKKTSGDVKPAVATAAATRPTRDRKK